jgi:hypothetical protein
MRNRAGEETGGGGESLIGNVIIAVIMLRMFRGHHLDLDETGSGGLLGG